MSDRLQELLHQRAAIQAHLAWLDREISQASTAKTAPSIREPAATSAPPVGPLASLPTTTFPSPLAPAHDPDTLLASYRQDSKNLRTDIRKGCLLYFVGAFLLLGLGIASFYFVNRLIRHQSTAEPAEQRATPAPAR